MDACDNGLFCKRGRILRCKRLSASGDPPCGLEETCYETNDSCGMTPIPTVSQWGLVVLAISLLIAGKIGYRRVPKWSRI